VALTAFVRVIGRGTGIAIAAASGGSSSSRAAWKYASAIAASLSAFAIRLIVFIQYVTQADPEIAMVFGRDVVVVGRDGRFPTESRAHCRFHHGAHLHRHRPPICVGEAPSPGRIAQIRGTLVSSDVQSP
jgi:hypothetical protein